mmetsp:Transcript_18684/g.48471  ORF Transcript_18684/g.48471 Transcript_18684/m.48471 type:complete len:283 (-) Transcript_18684:824-1672(-)
MQRGGLFPEVRPGLARGVASDDDGLRLALQVLCGQRPGCARQILRRCLRGLHGRAELVELGHELRSRVFQLGHLRVDQSLALLGLLLLPGLALDALHTLALVPHLLACNADGGLEDLEVLQPHALPALLDQLPAYPVQVLLREIEAKLRLGIDDDLLAVKNSVAVLVVVFLLGLDLFLKLGGRHLPRHFVLLRGRALHGLGGLPGGLLDPGLEAHERRRGLTADGLSLIDDVLPRHEEVCAIGASNHREPASLLDGAGDADDGRLLQRVLPGKRCAGVVRTL